MTIPATRKATIEPTPSRPKTTKRYQAEEANCCRQKRGNLEVGQYATPADLIAEDFDDKSISGLPT
jgi:exopolysaccharide biosynthesis protein